jgi:hypothetical protein
MPQPTNTFRRILTRETAILLWFALAGIFLLPVAIFLVGQTVFGEYGGGGFGDFYRELHYQLRIGDPVVWYLVSSPYIFWQMLRLTIWAFRRSGRTHLGPASGTP